jgi:hypothetical protein
VEKKGEPLAQATGSREGRMRMMEHEKPVAPEKEIVAGSVLESV